MLRILQNGKELAINADHHIVLSSKQSIEIKNSNNKNLTSKIEGKDLTIYEEGSDIPLVTIEDYVNYMPDIYVSPFNLPFGEAITPLTLSSGISATTLGLGALALGGVGAAIGGGGGGSSTPEPNTNTAPVAVDDAITVTQDALFTSSVDLDNNDADIDGDTLSVVAGTFTTTEGGTLVLASDGSYSYTPASGFTGTDTVDYTVTDGNLTDTGTLTINVSSLGDTAPKAHDDAIAVTQDTTFISSVDLDSNDTDVDGDTLSVVAGTFTTTEGGTLILASDGSYTYTPASGFTGTDTVDYTLTDGNLTDTGTLSIEVFPPTTVTINSISEDTGVDATDFITSDNDGLTINATLSGALYGNEVLEYSNDGGTTWIDITSSASGKTVSYVDDALTSTNTIMMRVIDTGGNAGTEDSQLITIDTTPPPTPTIDSYIDNIGPITSNASTETTTDDSYITLQGKVTDIQAEEVVNVYEDGTLLGTAIVSGSDWTYNVVLTDTSTHTYTVATVDAAGNTTAGTESLDVALNTMVQLEATGVTNKGDKNPQITALNDGAYVVTYQGEDSDGDDYSIFVQKFSSDGTIQGDQVKLEGTDVTNGNDYTPQITALNDGAYVVTYYGLDSDGDYSIFVQKFDSSGAIQGAQVKLEGTGGDDKYPQITALNDGAYIVTYQGEDSDGDDYSIFVQKFSSDGTIQGDQVKLEGTDVTNGNDYTPQITAVGEDGAYVVTYYGRDSDDGYSTSIFVQKFSSNGTIQETQVQLEAPGITNGTDYNPQITALNDGAYVVTYYGLDSDGDYSIFVQKFDSSGAIQGAQVKLEGTGGDDKYPQITALNDGAYIVTYQGEDSDGDDYSIFVQKFSSDGTIQGDQVKLEGTDVTNGNDYTPQITAVGEDGAYVVTYYGRDSDGDYSVFVQKFNSDGTIFVETDSSSVGPVALDINGDGIITYEAAFMDINFDDILDTTAWVSGGDGILVWDEYGDGVFHDASQFAFGSNGLTDLEGLAALFDTNSDGIFDGNDTEFGNFGALVDGEIISLADLGITSIDLHSNQEMTHPLEGVTVHGDSTATLVDGTTMLIQDVAFDYEANGGV